MGNCFLIIGFCKSKANPNEKLWDKILIFPGNLLDHLTIFIAALRNACQASYQ
jgi:hypothetical protein